MVQTLKSINAAIAAKGIALSLMKADHSYPFYFDGDGVEMIRMSVVPNVKRVNQIPLDEWLRYAAFYAEQIAEQRERIRLPDWIKVGAKVVTAYGGLSRDTVITRVYSDGSERAAIAYESGENTWLWGDGSHCTGPNLFRDQPAYMEAVAKQKHMVTMLGLFGRLDSARQSALIEQIKGELA